MGRVDSHRDDDAPEDDWEKWSQNVKAKDRQQDKETNPNHDLKDALCMVGFWPFCKDHLWLGCHEQVRYP
jgi:hypothetical protein